MGEEGATGLQLLNQQHFAVGRALAHVFERGVISRVVPPPRHIIEAYNDQT